MMELLAMEESIASHSMMKQYIAFEPSAPNNLLCRCYSVVDVVLLVCCCCATVVVLFLLCYIVRYHRLCATVLSLWFVVVMSLLLLVLVVICFCRGAVVVCHCCFIVLWHVDVWAQAG